MDVKAGALSGAAGTVAMSGLNAVLGKVGLVYETVPMQVVDRAEEVGLLEGWSPARKRAVGLATHLGYGITSGMLIGALRREHGQPTTEFAVGIALGLMVWGIGWSSWLPLLGVHEAPWNQNTPGVWLPVVGHAVFGGVWGLTHWALTHEQE